MFCIGDLVVYGNTGLCRVVSIGPSELAGAERDRIYYGLEPYYSNKSIIFTPCDSAKVVLRAIISKEEADELIEAIDSIETLIIEDEKLREPTYKSIIRNCDCHEIMSIIKTIYKRKAARIAEGKKVTANDEKYFLIAEEKLYGELAVALNITKDKVRELINDRFRAMA